MSINRINGKTINGINKGILGALPAKNSQADLQLLCIALGKPESVGTLGLKTIL